MTKTLMDPCIEFSNQYKLWPDKDQMKPFVQANCTYRTNSYACFGKCYASDYAECKAIGDLCIDNNESCNTNLLNKAYCNEISTKIKNCGNISYPFPTANILRLPQTENESNTSAPNLQKKRTFCVRSS